MAAGYPSRSQVKIWWASRCRVRPWARPWKVALQEKFVLVAVFGETEASSAEVQLAEG